MRIIVVCTGITMYLNWIWIDGFRPSTRFFRLVGDIEDVNKLFYRKESGDLTAKLVYLNTQLSRLGIQSPQINDIADWQVYLNLLYSLCRQKDLKQARGLYENFILHFRKRDAET